jgi:hypothetical protein
MSLDFVDVTSRKKYGCFLNSSGLSLSRIAQVACRLTRISRESARRASFFHPDRRLRSRKRLELVGSDHESVASWFGIAVFQRSGQICRAGFVQFGAG